MKRVRTTILGIAAVLCAFSTAHAQSAVGNGFTYQGQLSDAGAPANGQYDLSFRLHDAATDGATVGNPVTLENVQVTDGLFNVELDFGPRFAGDARWISISVRPGASDGSYLLLSPRQELTPTPYAISAYSLQLPFTGGGASAGGGLFDPGMFNIIQSGSGHAVKGTTQGIGAAIRGDAMGPNGGIGVHGTSWLSNAGRFEITNDNNSNIALLGRSSGSGYAVYAQNSGTGKAPGAIQNGSSGDAAHFRVTGFGNQSAAVRAETDNSGAAVYARSQSGPALQISRGHIKVDGAGLNTSTPVFIHRVTSSNRWSNTRDGTAIDHPLCNNDPDAILIITPRVQFGQEIPRAAVGVIYGVVSGRWSIYTFDQEEMEIGQHFNVMVVKP